MSITNKEQNYDEIFLSYLNNHLAGVAILNFLVKIKCMNFHLKFHILDPQFDMAFLLSRSQREHTQS
jgi:hypothetical protein